MLKVVAEGEACTATSDFDKAETFLRGLFPSRNVKRILLITPPDADATMFRFDTAKRKRYTNFPPYGLAVLGTQLRDEGFEVKVCNLNHVILKAVQHARSEAEFDFEAVWQSEVARVIESFKPDLLGLTCMFTMTHTSFKNVCSYVSKFSLPIAIGGVAVSNDVERILDDMPLAQIAFIREGDVSFPTFLKVANGTAPIGELGQVILNDTKNSTRYRFPRELLPSSEKLNIVPAYDLLDVPEYSDTGVIGAFYFLTAPGTKIATALTNRGCRAQCTFCSVRNFNGAGVRQRSIESVIEELKVLKYEYGVGHISWLDDDLLKDEARIIHLFNEMVRNNLNLTWDATNGIIAAACSEEVAQAMAASGCIALNIGMESGNPKILREVRKPGTVEKFLQCAEILRKYEQIHSSVFLMVGFPGETMRMILDTINVARKMNLDWYRISQLQPLPNTPIYDSMVAQGLIQDVGSKELRFMGGAYGKQTEMEHGLRMASADFQEAFSSIPLDSVPSPEQVTDIWFYMNYHLNFHRLFTETRPNKVEEQIRNLENLADRISPENGFATYFLGYLNYQLTGGIPSTITERLESILSRSPYWTDRLGAFGLSVDDLRKLDFKNKEIPCLVPGNLPVTEMVITV